jgi:outer membrane protein assembly factor BamB
MRCLALFLLAAPALAQIEDPAPPEVNRLETVEAPAAKPFDELTTHRAPRALAEGATVEDWPSFLGPRRDGTSVERISAWGEDGPPLLWEVAVGEGYAQPVVAAGRVVVLHRQGGSSHVDCLDAETGQRHWRRSYPCAYRPRYVSDAGPRATPTIDGGWVYVHGVEGRLSCLELTTGRVRWQRDLSAEFGLGPGFFGVVSSPLVLDGQLIVNVGTPGPSVVSFDKHTGRMLWAAGEEWGASCASPVVAHIGGSRWLLVVTGGESLPPTGGLMVLDPQDGRVAFRYPFRSRTAESVNAACPLVFGDDVFLTAAYGVGAACIRWSSEGGFSEAWRARRGLGLQFSNPVSLRGRVMALDGKSDRVGELVQVDPGTGKELGRTVLVWPEKVVYRGAERELDFSAGEGSLLVVDGRLLCLGDRGHLLWIDASEDEAQVLARAWLFRARESWTPPALSRGLLYVRQTSRETFGERLAPRRVLCFDLRGE